jgi:hypothetical protein
MSADYDAAVRDKQAWVAVGQGRITLAEADATGGDIRALCDLSGISIASVHRYSANAAIDICCAIEPGPLP